MTTHTSLPLGASWLSNLQYLVSSNTLVMCPSMSMTPASPRRPARGVTAVQAFSRAPAFPSASCTAHPSLVQTLQLKPYSVISLSVCPCVVTEQHI